MSSPTTPYSYPLPNSDRRSRRVLEGERQEKKPKKVNSEIRKQQNRIASRNYREKRKRKLQYLQQLVKDDSNDEKTPEPSPQLHQTQIRSCSREFDVGPSSSPFMPPSSSDIVSISSSNASALSPIPVASTVTYDSHHITARQTCSPFEMSWSNTIYDPRLANTYTPGWAPSIAYHPQVAPRQGDYTSSAPAAHTVFGQTTSPYLHPRDLPPNADHFYLGMFNGPYNGSQSQTYSIPSYFFGDQVHSHGRHIYT